jgi:acetyl-CoA C-acetyltransferase
MKDDAIVIASGARTPMGGFGGELSTLTAPQLGAAAIKAAIERAGIEAENVDETIMGCVLPAGLGQAPARQAALLAGLPPSIPATTVNKMCGSGMKAVMLAHDAIAAGSSEIVVAGGMESMSNAPYLLPRSRSRMGHHEVKDHMFLDGLEDAYDKGRLMGTFAEDCAGEYCFSREAQDEFAISSLERARDANEGGAFGEEIVSIEVGGKSITRDEQPFKAKIEKIPQLKPAFKKDGTVTAANSSSISDGAAALVLMRLSEARERRLTPLARVVAHATYAHGPGKFTTAPISAIRKVLDKARWSAEDVDLFEINEAFAVVAMAAMKDLGLARSKVNVHGGACALGHPIGASGARILVTLLYALKQQGAERGVASLCIGGGEATAVAVQRLGGL